MLSVDMVECSIWPTCVPIVQNVQPDKLFSRERAVKQLLEIIDNATSRDQASYIAWDGQRVPW